MGANVHVFIFRRDLRTHDNLGWIEAVQRLPTGHTLRPVFALCAEQADPKLNPVFNKHSVEFMMAALQDLRSSLQKQYNLELRVIHGFDELDAVKRSMPLTRIASVAFNGDVTQYARKRDDAMLSYCKIELGGVPCYINTSDYVLSPLIARPYRVFSPFFRYATSSFAVPDPITCTVANNPSSISVATIPRSKREDALAVLRNIKMGAFDGYAGTRNLITMPDGTTHLSTYIKFGVISIREAYHAMKHVPDLLRQLYWRAFYDQLTWHFPEMVNTATDHRKWTATRAQVEAWKRGETGVPLVDAGMRELATTGRMHNRIRMVCASYLIWDMNADWREGERHFARYLEDYHPSANAGNWLWIARQPPFRVMSPDAQATKYDRQGDYVRAWITSVVRYQSTDH